MLNDLSLLEPNIETAFIEAETLDVAVPFTQGDIMRQTYLRYVLLTTMLVGRGHW